MAPRWARDRSRWPRTRSKIAKILQDNSKKNKRVFSHCFLTLFCPRAPPRNPKHVFSRGFLRRNPSRSQRQAFSFVFVAPAPLNPSCNMAPRWPKTAQQRRKRSPRQTGDEPKMDPRSPKMSPRWTQDSSRCPRTRFKIAKILQDSSKKEKHVFFPLSFVISKRFLHP